MTVQCARVQIKFKQKKKEVKNNNFTQKHIHMADLFCKINRQQRRIIIIFLSYGYGL